MYVRHGVVPRDWVLEAWHHPLREMRAGAEVLRAAAATDGTDGGNAAPWPELWELLAAADGYRSHHPCCVDGAATR
jgi:hypothetical protein